MRQLSIGIDIVEPEVIGGLIVLSGSSFLKRTFSEKEIRFCENKTTTRLQTYAGKFAAKEAFMKALGTGWDKKIQWTHIEVLNTLAGKPYIDLHKKAEMLFREEEFTNIILSISHTPLVAVACVILQ